MVKSLDGREVGEEQVRESEKMKLCSDSCVP